MTVVKYPNSILMEATVDVAFPADDSIRNLVNDMFVEMEKAGGIGLAGNQFGTIYSLFVVNYKEKNDLFTGTFINPEIVRYSPEKITAPEMCLSLPGVKVNKERSKTIVGRWQDIDGQWHEEEFTGLRAIIWQHEHNHLQGKTIISSLPRLKQKILVDKMRKVTVKSARQRAKEMSIPMPDQQKAQEQIDILTGKRVTNE